ncbi:protein ECT2-like isoform X1 [Ciona intestinalis]
MGNKCSTFFKRCPCFGGENKDEETEPLLKPESSVARSAFKKPKSVRSILGTPSPRTWSSCTDISAPIITPSSTNSLQSLNNASRSRSSSPLLVSPHHGAKKPNQQPGVASADVTLTKQGHSLDNANTLDTVAKEVLVSHTQSFRPLNNSTAYQDTDDTSALYIRPSLSSTSTFESQDYDNISLLSSSSDADVPTKRHRTAMELLQTETTYLRNLNTILKVYKEPLQKAADEGKPLLAPEDIRNAFGGIDDIAKLHACIHQDLSEMIDNWEEDCCIAHIFTKYREQLLKVYPPYVNYFDMGKEILMKQEKANPELGEFFLACFHEPQSLKQPLNALLIRPVQRLPSISLLINDLHKRTDDGLKDKTELEEAKKVLKQVLSHINEDKRKTEGKMKIFDIVYEVDGCPVEVVSSNRLFVSRVDVATLTDGLYRSGERLALYLLTDVLEVAKWRNRSHGKSAPLLKHIQLLPLSNIISIWDVQDNDECKNLFAVKYKSQGNAIIDGSVNGQEEKLSVLQLLDDRTFKSKWLKALTAQIAEVKQEKVESVMKQVEPMELAGHVKKGSKILKKLTRVKPKAE